MADVLIVEDDKFLSKIYKTKLEKEGIEAEFAGDGEEGLKMMKENKPKVVLADLIMPKMDGFAMLEAMHKDEKLKKLPVLVLTNLGQEEDAERVKKLGAKEFIVKSDSSIKGVIDKIKSYL